MTNTPERRAALTSAAREVIAMVGDGVREAGSLGLASGDLYAMLMPVMSLDTYNRLIAAYVSAGKIKNVAHRLYWIDD